jgi:hypothetical protein
VAVDPKKRLRAHSREGAKWVSEVASSTYERFRTHKEVLAAEIKAIQDEAPLWNVVHAEAGRLRVLRPVRAANGSLNVTRFSMPLEPCFARKGALVSFRTQGRAEHIEYELLNDHCRTRDYRAVLDWMEWFGYHYEHGCVSSQDGSFCGIWDDVLKVVTDDWYYEFVVRPKLDLESDLSKIQRPLWMTAPTR